MLELIQDYGLFLAKSVTVVLTVAAITLVIVAASRRRDEGDARLKVEKLNSRFERLTGQLEDAALDRKARKALAKRRKAEDKQAAKAARDAPPRKRIFVLDFKGDIRASAVSTLRHEVSAVIGFAEERDEVLVRLENAGGIVHDHGLAASQLARLRGKGIATTVAVDKVAASGGYMMACVASRIIAAPFAVLGSIGVVAQLPNFHRLLKDSGIDYELFKAGQYKRTVTMFGENDDIGRAKFTEEIQETHDLFKHFVAEHRPALDLERVATGEHWYGRRALELELCDELRTSDDWLLEQSREADLFSVRYEEPQPLARKLLRGAENSVVRILTTLAHRLWQRAYEQQLLR